MSGFLLVLAAVAVCVIAAVYMKRRQEERRRFRALIQLGERLASKPVQPNLGFAASAYAYMADLRRANLATHPAQAIKAYIDVCLRDGATTHQLQSAQWGAAYAAHDDLASFEAGLVAYEETVRSLGREPANASPADKLKAAALTHLTLVLREFPDEYERFLGSTGQQAAPAPRG